MYRFHSPGDQKAIRKHWRQRKVVADAFAEQFGKEIDLARGRCRKMDGHDCGQARCDICQAMKRHRIWNRHLERLVIKDELRQWAD